MAQTLQPAVFLDRDGTLIEERNYLHRPEEVAVFPGAAGALRRLKDSGLLLFIVSNQSGVGRGYFSLADVDAVNQKMISDLGFNPFQHIYIAPEAPSQPSRGRKPSPQFLFDARDTYNLDLARSWMIGDKLIDLECGWNAGLAGSILVRTGYGAELEKTNPPALSRALIVSSLSEAAEKILSKSHSNSLLG